MNLESWINEEVSKLKADIGEFEIARDAAKQKLKGKQDYKKALGRKNAKNLESHEEMDLQIAQIKTQIKSFNGRIDHRKERIRNLQILYKLKPVRTKTGAIVSLKRLEDMQKKIGKNFDTEIIEHPGAIQLIYQNKKSKGKFTLNHLHVTFPSEVELPIFE